MDFDDLIIGSGLAALATATGLPAGRHVLVLAGDADGGFQYYATAKQAPCAFLGPGGLGQYWHGVIPTARQLPAPDSGATDFSALFARFYPHANVAARLGQPWLFVPWRPIRPRAQWQRLIRERPALQTINEAALAINLQGADSAAGAVSVRTRTATYLARRVWLAAGCLHTPALLEQAVGQPLARSQVSDHVIAYLGQIDLASTSTTAAAAAAPTPHVQHSRDGMWIPARFTADRNSLCTLRPARFAFAQLDAGIEQRAAFGLPAGSATRKILSGASPGLIAEALYTRLGLFPAARRQSVYAQVAVPDAYGFDAARGQLLDADRERIRRATDQARAQCPWPELIASRRPDLFLPGIHLHHTLHRERLSAAGLDRDASSVQIVDASTLADPGPEHHSFGMMLTAMMRARRSG